MKIEKFHINNFRSLVEVEINKFETTTIFYGENNAGKSNILNALSAIFQRKTAISTSGFTAPLTFHQGILPNFSNNFHKHLSNDITFSVDITLDTVDILVDSQTLLELKLQLEPKNLMKISGKISRLPNDSNMAEMQTSSITFNGIEIYRHSENSYLFFPNFDKKQQDQSRLSQIFTNLIEPLNDCVYTIGSERYMQPAMFNNSAQTISPESFKNFLHQLYLSEKNYILFEQIGEIFNQDPFNFGTISFSKNGGDLEIMIKSGEFRLPIKYVGSGILQVLYIITSILHHKNQIVCIEEMEQNLSPNKQYQLLHKIQSMIHNNNMPLKQILLSSHSSVYYKPKLGQLYFLEKKADRTIIIEGLDKKFKAPAQAYFAQTIAPYTPAEIKKNQAEIAKMLKDEQDFR